MNIFQILEYEISRGELWGFFLQVFFICFGFLFVCFVLFSFCPKFLSMEKRLLGFFTPAIDRF